MVKSDEPWWQELINVYQGVVHILSSTFCKRCRFQGR